MARPVQGDVPLSKPALLALLLLVSTPLHGALPPGPVDPVELENFLDGIVRKSMAEGGAPGAAVAVVRDGRVLLVKGYGWADVAAKRPVDADRTLFPVGSVSKPVTATAVLELVERGKLRLGEDVNRYLRDFQIEPTFQAPITPHHLLTHTAGLDVTLIGTAAADSSEVQPLGRYLAENLPPRIRPPGEALSYSNHGYTLLGHLVETVSGQPFDRYIKEQVFRPLGMSRSGFAVPPGDDVALGYEDGKLAAPPVHPQIVPAAGLVTTATDMARFLIAHLEEERLLRLSTFREMHRPHFRQDPRMPGMSYGFFESFDHGQRGLFHTGGLRGFMSGLYLWPEHRLGLFVVDNGYDGGLIWSVAHGLLDHYFPFKPGPGPRPPGAGERARLCAGRYRLASHTRTTLEKASALRDRDLIVRDLGNGTVGIWGGPFVEVEPGLFQSPETGEKVAFTTRNGSVRYMVTEELFIGNQTWEKLPYRQSSSLHRDLLVLLLVVFVSALFVRPGEDLSLFAGSPESPPEADRAVRLGVLLAGLNVLFLALFVVAFRVAARGAGLLYGVPPLVTAALIVPLLAAPVALAVAGHAALAWKRSYWTVRWRLYYTALAVAGLGFLAFLSYWKLLGFRVR